MVVKQRKVCSRALYPDVSWQKTATTAIFSDDPINVSAHENSVLCQKLSYLCIVLHSVNSQFTLFTHSQRFNEVFIFSRKSHSCNSSSVDVQVTLLLPKNIYQIDRLF